jgi:hypothetical protein
METAAGHSQQTLVTLPPEQVASAIRACAPEPEWVAEMQNTPISYEDPAHSASVSLDDVCVKRQKATRKVFEESVEERKRVYNTIAHIAHAGQSYIINGQGVANVLLRTYQKSNSRIRGQDFLLTQVWSWVFRFTCTVRVKTVDRCQ